MNKQNQKTTISLIFIAFATIAAIFCVGYQYLHFHTPQKIDPSEYKMLKSGDYNYKINSLKNLNADYDYIEGWIGVKGMPPTQVDTKLVLYDEMQKYYISLPLKMTKNTAPTSQFSDGKNYDNCGFEGKISRRLAQEKNYKIGFLFYVGDTLCFVKTDAKYTAAAKPDSEHPMPMKND